MSERVFIGLGSNIADRSRLIDQALAALDVVPGVTVVQRSSIFETDPVGPPQPKYLNAVVEIATRLDPSALLDVLVGIERSLGRVRVESERNAPRTIDLDLLLFGERILKDDRLEIPHPRLGKRAFVLVPLVELDATLRDPVSGDLLVFLLASLAGNDGVAMWRARSPTSAV